MPTPKQEGAMAPVVLRCRTLYTCALDQRTTWWGRGQGKRATYYQHAMELPDLKAPCPEYGDVHAQMLQDVLRRVDKTYHAFVRRTAHGEAPGSARFPGQGRSTSFTDPQYGTGATNGATVDGGVLSLAQIGRILMRRQRPIAGTPKTVTVSKAADGW